MELFSGFQDDRRASATSSWTESSLAGGGVIHAMNGEPITTLAGFKSELKKPKPGKPVVLQIERNQQLIYVTLKMDLVASGRSGTFKPTVAQ